MLFASPVDKLLLVYYEPHGGLLEVEELDSVLKVDGFNMPFSAHLMEVELDAEKVVLPLLKNVRNLNALKEPPQSAEGCSDCRLLGELVGLV
jgi:hypothetical protein